MSDRGAGKRMQWERDVRTIRTPTKTTLKPIRWLYSTFCFSTSRLNKRKLTRMASSAMPRSVAGLSPAECAPIRFAGIMRQYSRPARSHEKPTACHMVQCLYLRCRYHAHVITPHEPQSSRTVATT